MPASTKSSKHVASASTRRLRSPDFRSARTAAYANAQPRARLTEAQERAGRLRRELLRRGVHSEVLRFCDPELLQENYFHAVLEASKSVFERIRALTGLTSDGAALVDEAFGTAGGQTPTLALNSLRTETERSEHTGLMNLMKGLAGAFRNPPAHAPRITWPIDEQEALDILTFVSMLHRRLDAAVVTRTATA